MEWINKAKYRYQSSLIKSKGVTYEIIQNSDTDKWMLINYDEKELIEMFNTKRECIDEITN